MSTEIRAMTAKLERLRDERDFDQCFAFAVYLAYKQIERNRLGRRWDNAVRAFAGKTGYDTIVRDYLSRPMDRDDMLGEEDAFLDTFSGAYDAKAEEDMPYG